MTRLAELVEQRGPGPGALAVPRAGAESPASPDESFQAVITRSGCAETPQRIFRERVPLLARPVDGGAAAGGTTR
jgi:hypothetical protein